MRHGWVSSKPRSPSTFLQFGAPRRRSMSKTYDLYIPGPYESFAQDATEDGTGSYKNHFVVLFIMLIMVEPTVEPVLLCFVSTQCVCVFQPIPP